MSWNDVIPAEVFVGAPKSTRGRKPSKWQYVWQSRVDSDGDLHHLNAYHGVDDGTNIHWYDNEKQAKAVVAYARAFGYIPCEARDD